MGVRGQTGTEGATPKLGYTLHTGKQVTWQDQEGLPGGEEGREETPPSTQTLLCWGPADR